MRARVGVRVRVRIRVRAKVRDRMEQYRDKSSQRHTTDKTETGQR